MELQLFTDLIDALSKVSDGLKTLTDFPKSERDKYRQILEETYRLIDTTLNMVIIRLGNILYLNDDSEFISEVVKLDNFQEWYEAERNFRLCHSLRASVREMERLATELSGRISIKDLNRLVRSPNLTGWVKNTKPNTISHQHQHILRIFYYDTATIPN